MSIKGDTFSSPRAYRGLSRAENVILENEDSEKCF